MFLFIIPMSLFQGLIDIYCTMYTNTQVHLRGEKPTRVYAKCFPRMYVGQETRKIYIYINYIFYRNSIGLI